MASEKPGTIARIRSSRGGHHGCPEEMSRETPTNSSSAADQDETAVHGGDHRARPLTPPGDGGVPGAPAENSVLPPPSSVASSSPGDGQLVHSVDGGVVLERDSLGGHGHPQAGDPPEQGV